MEFIWAKLDNKTNQRVEFLLNLEKVCDTLTICAVDFYQIYLDGTLVSYGPARTASGYIRPRSISVKGTKQIVVKIASYGVNTYSCDLQQPFFGAELTRNGNVEYVTNDFKCYYNSAVLTDVPRYTTQRGFVEMFDYNNKEILPLETESVQAPIIIDEVKDVVDYAYLTFNKIDKGDFAGFYNAAEVVGVDKFKCGFNVLNEIIRKDWTGYRFCDYVLPEEHTGFISLKIKAKTDVNIYLFFEEYVEDKKWNFRRGGCNDFCVIRMPQGEQNVTFFEPYALKYLKIVYDCADSQLDIEPSLITCENKNAKKIAINANNKIDKILFAAYNTFKQNAIDIFMDCPSRERAGWLCDSYFMGKAEHLFCGNNDIEKAFIQNILIGETPEIEKGMLPKCFPAEHINNLYIPNWALWFLVELKDYYDRTGDDKIIALIKDKVYGLVEFFKKYINEYGLLENLESWVFVEWSVSNDKEYLRGLNFPSNMIYAYALDCVAALYNDKTLAKQAGEIRKKIVELSFNGEFFCDNAVRLNGKLMRCNNHISETCQYYALFTGLCPTEEFKKIIMCEFGPNRNGRYIEIGKSNMFIGHYLRLLWLCDLGEYDRVISECEEYFYAMADKTGTLWEHDGPNASCNHGFASAVAVILTKCLGGTKGE